MDVAEFFAADGPLAGVLPGYSPRPQQIELASAIERVIAEGDQSSLISEAPTGVGKSAGVLVPALLSGKRAIVVTANIALQEQYARKDLPMLAEAFGVAGLPRVSWAVLKGISNYLCLLRYGRACDDPPQDLFGQWDAVQQWAVETRTGDIAELPFELNVSLRPHVVTSSDECSGVKCPKFEVCHAVRGRKLARQAQVIVTNYHLLYVDAFLRSVGVPNSILPDADVLVCDEGHRAADILRDCSGWRVTPFMVRWIAQLLIGGRKRASIDPGLGNELDTAATLTFDMIGDRFGKRSHVLGPDVLRTQRIVHSVSILRDRLLTAEGQLQAQKEGDAERQAMIASAVKRCKEIRMQLGSFFGIDGELPDGWAHWAEQSGRHTELRGSPLEVGEEFQEIVSRHPVTIVVSATLTDGRDFSLVERELGFAKDQGERLLVESPFDFDQTTVMVPKRMPATNEPTFKDAVGDLIEDAIERSRGKALCLFTSYSGLDTAYERLSRRPWPFPILRQGEGSRMELLRQFKESDDSVLLGTDSFWEGVDVPGRALRVLIIDKLPFPTPDDPIVSRLIDQEGSKGWKIHALGRAVVKLRQGFGRLVRRQGDFGVVIIADRRFMQSGYGKVFQRGLPEALSYANSMAAIDWEAIRA